MHTWKLPCDRLGILSISSILPQILPQTSSQTQGNFPEWSTKHPLFSLEISGNAKCWGPLFFFPFCLPENLIKPKSPTLWASASKCLFLSLFAVPRRFSLQPSCHLAVVPLSSFLSS